MSNPANEGYGVSITFHSGFFAMITAVNGPNQQRKAIDTTNSGTTMGTAGGMTFIPSNLIDRGEVSVDINFDPDAVPPIDQPAETITITFPIPSGKINPPKLSFSGFMTGFQPKVPINDKMTASATLKVSGAITYTASS
jgi:hypothetical protein